MNERIDFAKISQHEKPERSPGFLLWHISTHWRSAIEEVLKPIGLTHPQFVLLATLGWLTREGARVTQAAVGKLAGLDPNTTSQILKGLEQKKLIQRECSNDARVKNPMLTAYGRDALAKALPLVEKQDNGFFSPLKDKEMDALLRIFHKLQRSG